MIDGIKIVYQISGFPEWRASVNVEFGRTVLDSGALKERVRNINGKTQKVITHTGIFETYRIMVKEVCITGRERTSVNYYLTIEGSLHKNFFKGENYSPFKWENLQQEIKNIENGLKIIPGKAVMQNLEFGVNIPFPGPVFPFLQRNLISYKGHPFNRYNPDKNGVCLGFVCNLSHYSVKIYDKGKQFDLPGNLMRFELRFLKMQKLRGVTNLSDLLDLQKVNGFLPLLLEAWQNVLLYDDSINLKKPELNPNQKEALKNGGNPKYWERLKETDKRRFNYERDRFKKLVDEHGKNDHKKISDLIKKEWENLTQNCTNLPTGKTPELYKFTVKIKGKNVQNEPLPPEVPVKEFSYMVKRSCISCGRDISNQRGNSHFCSAKFVGEREAHRCRNIESNKRNNLKLKIKTITERGVLFDITPYIKTTPKNANTYF